MYGDSRDEDGLEEDHMEDLRQVKEELRALWRLQEQEQDCLMPRLTDLVLGHVRDDPRGVEDVRRVLELCPNLDSLQFHVMTPTVFSQNNMAKIIATCCPLLKKVSFKYVTHDISDYNLPYQLMVEIPKQQVQEFRWRIHPHPLEGPEAITMFSRHSETLQKIVLGPHITVLSKVLWSVLVGCSALEELSLEMRGVELRRRRTHTDFVRLEDAVEDPRACTRILRLNLAVTIPPLPLNSTRCLIIRV